MQLHKPKKRAYQWDPDHRKRGFGIGDALHVVAKQVERDAVWRMKAEPGPKRLMTSTAGVSVSVSVSRSLLNESKHGHEYCAQDHYIRGVGITVVRSVSSVAPHSE